MKNIRFVRYEKESFDFEERASVRQEQTAGLSNIGDEQVAAANKILEGYKADLSIEKKADPFRVNYVDAGGVQDDPNAPTPEQIATAERFGADALSLAPEVNLGRSHVSPDRVTSAISPDMVAAAEKILRGETDPDLLNNGVVINRGGVGVIPESEANEQGAQYLDPSISPDAYRADHRPQQDDTDALSKALQQEFGKLDL